jgi:hypothetical protein
MIDDVVAASVLPPAPGAHFISKVYDFLTNLNAANPGSGKMIGCLLKEKAIRARWVALTPGLAS